MIEFTWEPTGVEVELLLVLETELAAGILTVPDVEPKPKNVPIVGVVDNLRKVK